MHSDFLDIDIVNSEKNDCEEVIDSCCEQHSLILFNNNREEIKRAKLITCNIIFTIINKISEKSKSKHKIEQETKMSSLLAVIYPLPTWTKPLLT